MTLNYADARRVATVYIDVVSGGRGVAVAVTPLSYGWIFYYNSRDYVATGDWRKSWAGNAPFLVTRIDGNLLVLGTIDVRRRLTEYEQTVPPSVMAMEPELPPTDDLRLTPKP